MRDGFVKRLVRRKRVDRLLDAARFRLDTFPRRGPLAQLSCVSYQPLPWVGIDGGRRAEGSRTRWHAISATLDGLGDVGSALDVGANGGFFTVSLAERGVKTVAVEADPVFFRTALYVIRRAGVEDSAAVLTLQVTPENVLLLPEVDAVILLSIWHHFVRWNGLEGATELLREIWARTRRVLFFDTGEDEMPPSFGLPRMEPDGRTWLERYLAETCEGSRIEHLGLHEAFDADLNPVKRNLFAVVRA